MGVHIGEESFTDFNLFDLQQAAGSAVRVRKFTRSEESQVGADWRWYVQVGPRLLPIRVQAKKAYAPKRAGGDWYYKELAESRSVEQLRRLVRRSADLQALPLYVLYTYTDQLAPWSSRWRKAPARFGCSLCSPWNAYRLAHVLKTPEVSAFAPFLAPWSLIFCGPDGRPRAYRSAEELAERLDDELLRVPEGSRDDDVLAGWDADEGPGDPRERTRPVTRTLDELPAEARLLAEGRYEDLAALDREGEVEPGVVLYTRLAAEDEWE